MNASTLNALQIILPVLGSVLVGFLAYLGVSKTAKAAHDQTALELKSELQKQQIRSEEQMQSIKKDINRLEEKQDKHNAVIERTFKLEQRVDDLEKRIK